MNNDKARDLFSAYLEGSLDAGLKQSIEQQLRDDPNLAADFAAFSEMMEELRALPREPIETPMFLSDRIATRMEQSALKPKPAHSFGLWLRGLGFAGLAAAGIGLVWMTATQEPGSAPSAVANLGPSAPVNTDQLNFEYADGKVLLTYNASGAKTITVRSGVDGEELQRFHLNGNRLETSLDNPLAGTAMFGIQVIGEPDVVLLAMPGSARDGSAQGQGSLVEMAASLSGFYRVPVLVRTSATTAVSWDFQSTDPRQSATEALEPLSASVDQRPSGMIVIR